MSEILKINPKFEQIIPPLSVEEFVQLEENILKVGRVIEPIQVWRGFIVDGHHRYKIVQKHPEITYKIEELKYECEGEVFAWICNLQLGRRNITENQKRYLVGKRYDSELVILDFMEINTLYQRKVVWARRAQTKKDTGHEQLSQSKTE